MQTSLPLFDSRSHLSPLSTVSSLHPPETPGRPQRPQPVTPLEMQLHLVDISDRMAKLQIQLSATTGGSFADSPSRQVVDSVSPLLNSATYLIGQALQVVHDTTSSNLQHSAAEVPRHTGFAVNCVPLARKSRA